MWQPTLVAFSRYASKTTISRLPSLMISTLSSIWGTCVPSSASTRTGPQNSTALDFLAVLATTNLKISDSSQLGLKEIQYTRLGRGGYAVVERGGRKRHQYVAVKMCRVPVAATVHDTQDAIDRHLNELGLEMRILSHPSLRAHSNIVDIVGICLDNEFGYSSLSLVLEYSEHGSLRNFLLEKNDSIELQNLFNLVSQVAQGLEALHQQLISHGDIKAENCLVFQKSQEWIVKLSDFGGSVVGQLDKLSDSVQYRYGTRLLNAPEIRSGSAIEDPYFGINEAMLSDVFAFGLLTWEVLKGGQSYFDKEWIGECSGQKDEDMMEAFLESLPHNGILKKSTEFIQKERFNPEAAACMHEVFRGSLQDLATDRMPMRKLCKLLQPNSELEVQEMRHDYQPICTWSRQMTFFEIHDRIRDDLTLVSQLPFDTQKRIFQELMTLASSEALPLLDRGHAAICVAECYLLGFGVAHDVKMMVQWVLKSAVLGCEKAQAWYHRIAPIVESEVEQNECVDQYLPIEAELAEYPPSEYLARRIRSQVSSVMEIVKTSISPSKELRDSQQYCGTVFPDLFTGGAYVEAIPLHIAAFVGDDSAVELQLNKYVVDTQCPRGFTALHYACLGAHLSTVELLLARHASLQLLSSHGIGALHLCLCFSEADVPAAVSLLLRNGADANAKVTMPFKWEYHDLVLQGTPLEWAVRSRNRTLVRILLPIAVDFASLEFAISHFYWEITEDILRHFEMEDCLSLDRINIDQVSTPFGIWIAHGANLQSAMRETMTCCHNHGALATESDGQTTLMYLVNVARAVYDFDLIDICLDLIPQDHVKWVNAEGYSALSNAITKSSSTTIWENILKKMVEMYSIEELESEISLGSSFLHLAVSHDSVVAARVLLERGVDVNQRTYDELGVTPLHICMTDMCTHEMFSLLLQHGADLNVRERMGHTTPFELRLLGKSSVVDFLASLLENPDNTFDFTTILHVMLEVSMALAVKTNHRTYSQDAFRLLLSSPRVAKFIDEPDSSGLTLLHKAVRTLHLNTVSLLLEAGVDANVPYMLTNSSITLLPLQIAVNVGSRFWLHSIDDTYPQLQLYKASAMAISSQLLQWHHARGDAHFRGITKLHLACRMNISDEVNTLIAAREDPLALGHWPGINHHVTPADLVSANFFDESAALDTMTPEPRYTDEGLEQALKKSITFNLDEARAVQSQIQEKLRGGQRQQ